MLEWIIRNSFLGITVVEEEVGSVNRSLSRQILILTTWSSNHFSRYFVDKTEKDVIEVMREFEKLSKQGKSFVLVYEKKILSGRADAYLHSMASNLIITKTELAAERVSRMLYIPKMVGEGPLDKLIKITVDGAGVQEDTREYVGQPDSEPADFPPLRLSVLALFTEFWTFDPILLTKISISLNTP